MEVVAVHERLELPVAFSLVWISVQQQVGHNIVDSCEVLRSG
jgi:hypothetical protein